MIYLINDILFVIILFIYFIYYFILFIVLFILLVIMEKEPQYESGKDTYLSL